MIIFLTEPMNLYSYQVNHIFMQLKLVSQKQQGRRGCHSYLGLDWSFSNNLRKFLNSWLSVNTERMLLWARSLSYLMRKITLPGKLIPNLQIICIFFYRCCKYGLTMCRKQFDCVLKPVKGTYWKNRLKEFYLFITMIYCDQNYELNILKQLEYVIEMIKQ